MEIIKENIAGTEKVTIRCHIWACKYHSCTTPHCQYITTAVDLGDPVCKEVFVARKIILQLQELDYNYSQMLDVIEIARKRFLEIQMEKISHL
jgi:hypothetical protein